MYGRREGGEKKEGWVVKEKEKEGMSDWRRELCKGEKKEGEGVKKSEYVIKEGDERDE